MHRVILNLDAGSSLHRFLVHHSEVTVSLPILDSRR